VNCENNLTPTDQGLSSDPKDSQIISNVCVEQLLDLIATVFVTEDVAKHQSREPEIE
jgi:hypothetical protein